MMMARNLELDSRGMITCDNLPSVKIAKRGIVTISSEGNGYIAINDENIIDLINKQIKEKNINPKTDCEGRFAGIVAIEIGFWCDMEENER